MGNKLFQLAKEAVYLAETSSNASAKQEDVQNNIMKAKNQLSSAFANSTAAEQLQLQELQQRLDQVENNIK